MCEEFDEFPLSDVEEISESDISEAEWDEVMEDMDAGELSELKEMLTDTPEDLARLRGLLDGFSCVRKVEFLPFHKICAPKYEKLGIPFPFDRYPAARPGLAEELSQVYARLRQE